MYVRCPADKENMAEPRVFICGQITKVDEFKKTVVIKIHDPFIVDQRDNNHCSEPKDHPHDLFCHKIRFSASDHHDTDDRNCNY